MTTTNVYNFYFGANEKPTITIENGKVSITFDKPVIRYDIDEKRIKEIDEASRGIITEGLRRLEKLEKAKKKPLKATEKPKMSEETAKIAKKQLEVKDEAKQLDDVEYKPMTAEESIALMCEINS